MGTIALPESYSVIDKDVVEKGCEEEGVEKGTSEQFSPLLLILVMLLV